MFPFILGFNNPNIYLYQIILDFHLLTRKFNLVVWFRLYVDFLEGCILGGTLQITLLCLLDVYIYTDSK